VAERALRKQGKYRLLRPDETSDGFYRLMHGSGENEYLAGYVANPENFTYAVNEAEEEMRCLMAQARQEFGL
jgi:hypothetical protein